MAKWLFKEELETYRFADLQRDGETTWDGVTNALAQKHLRAVKKGDQVFFYQTGGEKAVVGIMEAVADPVPAADDPTGKRVAVKLRPVRALARPVTLAAIKADAAFAGWELVRVPRLSVMPVSDDHWKRVVGMSDDAHG